MFNRAYLKDRAKSLLSLSYWPCMGAAALLLGLSLIASFAINIFHSLFSSLFTYSFYMLNPSQSGSSFSAIIISLVSMVLSVAVAVLPNIFVTYPLTVGLYRYFLDNQLNPGRSRLDNLVISFTSGNYKNIVTVMFAMVSRILLWSLLFIIPGIIKTYEYKFVPYIMADNPRLDSNRALEISSAMTNGLKLDIFIFELSFIGWYILGIAACYVGVLFVLPYYYAAEAEIYASARHNAFTSGVCHFSELGFADPAGQPNVQPPVIM